MTLEDRFTEYKSFVKNCESEQMVDYSASPELADVARILPDHVKTFALKVSDNHASGCIKRSFVSIYVHRMMEFRHTYNIDMPLEELLHS